jgi:Ca2+/H+ antiporter, TMEM165/GDT1 family
MLQAFTSALLLITSQEIGDKTFLIVLILASRHPRHWVFIGAMAALAVMTVIAVIAGQVISILPAALVRNIFVGLFLGFGVWLLWKAARMPASVEAPLSEAAGEIQKFEAWEDKTWHRSFLNHAHWLVILEAFSLTFLAEWGDRTQLATMALATTQVPGGVILGAIAGHTISSLLAVLGGRWAAGRISEKMLTALGGILFLIFGILELV